MSLTCYVACSGCGIGLPVRNDEGRVRCDFCGATSPVTIAEELSAFSEDLSAMQREASMALLSVWEQRVWSARAFAISKDMQGTMMMFFVVMTSVSLSIVTWKMASLSFLGLCIAFLFYATMSLVWMGGTLSWMEGFKHTRKMAAFDDAMATLKDPCRRCCCPSCGAPLAIPGFALYLNCISCNTPLMAANKLLIKRLESTDERRRRWSAEAGRLTQEIEAIRKRRHIAYEGPLFITVLVLMVVLSGGLLIYAAS